MPRPLSVLVLILAMTAACQPPPETRNLQLQTLNDSGVLGTVTFTDLGGRTRVEIRVQPAGNDDMPAHIHPGTCDVLVPQPTYPLENVRRGASMTIVPASLEELFAGTFAVNLHRSNEDLATYTACVDLR